MSLVIVFDISLPFHNHTDRINVPANRIHSTNYKNYFFYNPIFLFYFSSSFSRKTIAEIFGIKEHVLLGIGVI